MEYIAYIIIAFTAIQLLVAFANFWFKQKLSKAIKGNKLVSVLIPARNEAHNMRNILYDMMEQDYKNIEVLVFDDQSNDNTAGIVKAIANNHDRIQLISSEGLPNDWLGKNYACHSLSQKAKGDYLLFLDADVRIKNNVIGQTLHFAEKHNLSLTSVFPKQIMRNNGEYATVPIMNYILLSLLPLILVRKIGLPSLAAANGQYMFFEGANYRKTLPHETMKSEKVEDIKIARHFKRNKLKIACLANETDIKCRMYGSYKESLNGFSKNVTTFFGNSILLSILFWLITTWGFIPILLIYSTTGLALYLIAVIVIRSLVSITSRQSVSKNTTYLIIQQLSLGLMIAKSIYNQFRKQYIWKGRNVH